MNFATLAVVDSKCHLKDSWVLDGCSNTHIHNDAQKCNFKITKKAHKEDIFRVRNSSLQIECFGQVKMIVDTPEGKRFITLANVGLAYGFLTNIVSMQLLNEMGYHWTSRSPTKLECEDYSLASFLYQDDFL